MQFEFVRNAGIPLKLLSRFMNIAVCYLGCQLTVFTEKLLKYTCVIRRLTVRKEYITVKIYSAVK